MMPSDQNMSSEVPEFMRKWAADNPELISQLRVPTPGERADMDALPLMTTSDPTPDDHAFQGIVTKLRTTRGSQFALNVMAEAAERIEALTTALRTEKSARQALQQRIDAALKLKHGPFGPWEDDLVDWASVVTALTASTESTDLRVEEIRARLAAATPGPWTVMIPDGEPYWIHSTGQTVLTKGIAFGDDAEFIANAPTDIALLLTKLDEAEKALGDVTCTLGGTETYLSKARTRTLKAEERERALIAGVREVLDKLALPYPGQSTYSPLNSGADWAPRAADARAILSHLLFSAPTEEGTNDDHS